jgi:uncharacterized protein YndB with AHSA1/START domain
MQRRGFVAVGIAEGMSLAAMDRGSTGTAFDWATPAATPETYDMVTTSRFDAPVARVWQAWSDAGDVKRWWGPKGFTAPVADIDFREGGTSLVCMRSLEGQDLYNTWAHTKIVPMERIEFGQRFADEEGNAIAAADAGLPPELPREVRHVITFTVASSDTTEMTVTESGYEAEWLVALSRAGMNECLDKIAALFAKE